MFRKASCPMIMLCAMLALSLSVQSEAGAEPARMKVWQASLRGSKTALALENDVADRFKLERFNDVVALRAAIAAKKLVPITTTENYAVDDALGEMDPANRGLYRHARPWVKTFLDDVLGEAHRLFGGRLSVTSLVRTVAYQAAIKRAYPRAAAAGDSPERRSSHLTGSTADITLKGMPYETRVWLRQEFIRLEKAGAVQATEERACFHVMVFPDYAEKSRATTAVR